MDDIRKVVAFNSVEEFWGLYNNVIPPSQLPGKANYYLFRDNIMPAWEDSANKDGGKWSIQVPREKCKGVVDKMWLYTVSWAVGIVCEVTGEWILWVGGRRRGRGRAGVGDAG
jgi:translation initiation factor 4E